MAARPARSVRSGHRGSGRCRSLLRPGGSVRRILICALALAALAPACGHDDPDPTVLRAGQIDIKLPDGWTVEDAHAVRPGKEPSSGGPTGGTGQAGSAAPATTTPVDTVPLSQDDPQTAF